MLRRATCSCKFQLTVYSKLEFTAGIERSLQTFLSIKH
jgi:hypothetical protein